MNDTTKTQAAHPVDAKKERHSINVADGTVTMVYGKLSATFHATKASEANRRYAEYAGWKSRLQDKAALSRDTTTGKSATDEEKMAATMRLIEWYESGVEEWNLPKGAVGPRGPSPAILQAVATVRKTTVEKIREFVAASAKKHNISEVALVNRMALAPDVAAELAKQAVGGPSADDLLAEMA